MTVSAAMLADLRLMVAEPSATPYSDEILTRYLERYPLMDTEGNELGEEGWTATYDLHAAAADVWEQKATLVYLYYDYEADGGKYRQSQLHDKAMEMTRYHSSRRKPSSRSVFKKPKENTLDDISEGLVYNEQYGWWEL